MPTAPTPSRLRRFLPGLLPEPVSRHLPAGLVHEYLSPPTGSRLRILTVIAPLPEGEVEPLRAELAGLPREVSPFGAVPGTHFARLAVLSVADFAEQRSPDRTRMTRSARLLDLVMHGGRAQGQDLPDNGLLLFTASYDGPGRDARADQEDYAGRLRAGLGPRADLIWGRCTGYPGSADAAAFAGFLRERTARSGYVFSASDREPSVDLIRSALELRRQVADLALSTRDLTEAELAVRLRAQWGRQLDHQLDADLAELTPNDLSLPGAPAGAVRAIDRTRTSAGALGTEPADRTPVLVPTRDGVDRLGGTTPPTDPDLRDVQNLVTSGYPRHHAARHVLLQVTDAAAARAWLDSVIDEIPTAGWAETLVDRLGRDVEGADTATPAPGRPSSPDFALHVALSHAGLRALRLPEAELQGFPVEFTEGMAAREAGLIPGTGTRSWQAPFDSGDSPHLLLVLSAPDHARLAEELRRRPDLVPDGGHGLTVTSVVEAGRISTAESPDGAREAGFREHFGFVDGLSQPRVHGVTTGRRSAELPPGEALLGYQDIDGDTAGSGLAAALARNGSYLVWRKLEQDVAGFDRLVEDLAGQLAGQGPIETDVRELAAAKLMGRWRDGTPITLSTQGPRPALVKQPFGFQEGDAEGFGCPIGAHVRRANPRDSRPVEPDPQNLEGGSAELEGELARRHRMLRRGIPYGRPASAGSWAGRALEVPDGAPGGSSGEEPQEERGLLFVALVGDIHRQFEFVQAHWMSDGNAFRLGSDRDAVSGAAPEGCKFIAQGPRPTFVRQDEQIVTCRGGEYFLLPGISALRRIARG